MYLYIFKTRKQNFETDNYLKKKNMYLFLLQWIVQLCLKLQKQNNLSLASGLFSINHLKYHRFIILEIKTDISTYSQRKCPSKT